MSRTKDLIRIPTCLVLLSLLLMLSVILSLSLGAVSVPFQETLLSIFGMSKGSLAGTIVISIRLPRTLMALLAGIALSASGVIFQAMLRNPLADPYLLGVSSGAALGAVASIAAGVSGMHPGLVPLAAMIGGGIAVAAVYFLARKDGGLPPHTLILAGVIISSFCSALVLFMNVMMEARQLQGALFWIMGSLSSPRVDYMWTVFLAVALGLALSLVGAARMNILTQGEEVAASLGVDVERDKKILFMAACLMTGAVVSVSGLIGFVGLVVPHAARMIFGPDHRLLLPAAALLGASFLIMSDVAARTVLAPAEVPVGVVTALIGAPFFFYLLRRQKRVWSGE